MLLLNCSRSYAQGYVKVENIATSKLKDDLGNHYGSGDMQIVKGRYSIPLYHRVLDNGERKVLAMSLSTSYAEMHNRGEAASLNPDNVLNASMNLSYQQPIGRKWSVMVSAGAGVYSSTDEITTESILANGGVIFITKLSDNLDLGLGTIVTNSYGTPIAMPVFSINWHPKWKNLQLEINTMKVAASTRFNKFRLALVGFEIDGLSAVRNIEDRSKNYLIDNNNLSLSTILKYSVGGLPWNWIIVLQLEIVFSKSRRDKIEKEKARYQFIALKNQVNPHFLFNSLSVLASLAYEDADKTSAFAKKLSSVYRYLLTTSEKPAVTLEEELKFVETYIYLEKLRFDDTLQTNITVPASVMNREVIPASIQMLVENAIKHNINSQTSPLIIDIEADNNSVTVSNTFQPRTDSAGSQTGLRNLRQQYALHGKTVEVRQTPTMFSVNLQFI